MSITTGLDLFQSFFPFFTGIHNVYMTENTIVNNCSIPELTALIQRAELFVNTTVPFNEKSNLNMLSGIAKTKMLNIISFLETIRDNKQNERVQDEISRNQKHIDRLHDLMKSVKVGDRVQLSSRYLDEVPRMLRNLESYKVEDADHNELGWRERKFTIVSFNLENGMVTLTPGKQMVGDDHRTQKERNFKVEFSLYANDIYIPKAVETKSQPE